MDKTEKEEGLKRVIGITGLSLNIVNITIGAGIFALPAMVAIKLGGFSVFAYIFCGFMMAAIMLCYAEIGTRVTKSGGSYAYVEAAFGDLAGFIVSWLMVFGWSILGSAALMNIITDSLAVVFPIFSETWMRVLFFALLLGFLLLTNIRGAKEGVAFTKWITIIKLVPLVGIIIFGFTYVDTSNLQWEHMPTFETFSGATLILFFAFAGFETALGVSGEIKNPQRTIPLGILLGGVLILVLYLLLQTVTQGVLGGAMLEAKDAPLAAVAEKIVGPIGGVLLLLAAAVSCFGSVSTDVLNTPRVIFAGSNDGLFPKFLGKVHPKFATPHWSISCFVALIFVFAVWGSFEQLAMLASAAILLIYLMVILATIKFKMKKDGSSEKLFKMPGGYLVPIIGLSCIGWLLSSLSRIEVIVATIFIVIVSIIYFTMKWIKRRAKSYKS